MLTNEKQQYDYNERPTLLQLLMRLQVENSKDYNQIKHTLKKKEETKSRSTKICHLHPWLVWNFKIPIYFHALVWEDILDIPSLKKNFWKSQKGLAVLLKLEWGRVTITQNLSENYSFFQPSNLKILIPRKAGAKRVWNFLLGTCSGSQSQQFGLFLVQNTEPLPHCGKTGHKKL